MIIRMTHPLHGEMDVYTEAEVTANQKNGWKLYETVKETVSETSKVVEKNTSEITIAEQYEAKFGKKPHHRMSQSTIEAALKE